MEESGRSSPADSLMGGRRVWLLAKLPNEYIIDGERISPYLVFSNTHDGSGAVSLLCRLNIKTDRLDNNYCAYFSKQYKLNYVKEFDLSKRSSAASESPGQQQFWFVLRQITKLIMNSF